MPRTTIDWESRIGRRLAVRDLHVFVTVVQRGSMAKAAQQLNVTQPAISMAIGDLEHTLGVRLLDRGPQGVEPTIYGRALLKRSNVVFDELKQSIMDIEFLADPTVGEVRFGCHDTIAAILPPIMKRFSQRYPRVALRMEVIGPVGAAPELPSLHQRLIDFAMFRLSAPLVDLRVTDELHVEVLFNDQLVVAAGRHTRWARRRKIDLAELIAEPWIMPGPPLWNYVELAEACRARGIDMPKARLETMSSAVRAGLLATGPYIATFPRSTMRLYADSLAVLPVALPIRPWPFVIITLKNRTLSPVVERFIECTREVTKSFDTRPQALRP